MKRRVEVTMSVTRAMLLREGLKVEKKNVEESLQLKKLAYIFPHWRGVGSP